MVKHKFIAAAIFLLILSCGRASANQRSISGQVIYEGEERGGVVVNLYKLRTLSEGRAVRLDKGDIYGNVDPFQTLKLNKPGSYTFDGLAPG